MKRMFKKKKTKENPKDSVLKAKEEADTPIGLDEYGMQSRELQKPHDQLELTDAEKNKEHTRILTATNPHAPDNIIRFSFKDSEFKRTDAVDQLAVHFSLSGYLIHQDSDEARRQTQRAQAKSRAGTKTQKKSAGSDSENSDSDSDDEDHHATIATGTDEPQQVLRNQFNFSERAAQTFNNPYRHREEQTEPPPRADFTATVNQWGIFDAYQQDQEKKEREKAASSKKGGRAATEDRNTVNARKRAALEFEKQQSNMEDCRKISNVAKIVERMVNQNTFSDIADDYKYFDDDSDQYREMGKGTLLPLWKFSSEATHRLSVTSICWSNQYTDLFAVSYGSFNFSKQNAGALLLFSLKNPTYPEYTFTTESGVMSVDINPESPHYVCVGFYNGDVAVFNLKNNTNFPEYKSTNSSKCKHTEPVWQVKWQPNNLDSLMNFCSISSDGRVNNWSLVKNELMSKTVVVLKNVDTIDELDDPLSSFSLASGTSFAFHPENSNLFLTGTEEGKIFKSYQSYTSRYLDIIPAHHMTIEAIEWSPFHPGVFMSCSQDWSLKIWDHNNRSQPLFVFELGAAVGACNWSWHSSTVFSAVTNDGKAHIFDISVNKYEPLASQVVTQKKKTKLTSVTFNKVDPILVVGDDRGHVTTLKLSPNLRKIPKQKKGQVYKLDMEVEKKKLEKIVDLVRTK